MPRSALPVHVHRTVARGREYFAYHPFRGTKRAGPRVLLPGAPTLADGTPNPAWWAAYHAAAGSSPPEARPGTFAALIAAWIASPEYTGTKPATRENRKRHLRRIREAWGDLAVRALRPKHVLDLRDAYAETPAEANNMLRTLSSMLTWAVPRDWRPDNPCDNVRMLKGGVPYAAWPRSAIDAARDLMVPEMWAVVALAYYTGQRRGDVLAMSWSQIAGGRMQVTQEKTGKKVWITLHRDLAAVLATMPRRSPRILVNRAGKPWTNDGFGHMWAEQMDCLALVTGEFEGLVLHGLRKSAVVALLEAGCSTAEVNAITGQSLEMIEHYARDLGRESLAPAAILKWEQRG